MSQDEPTAQLALASQLPSTAQIKLDRAPRVFLAGLQTVGWLKGGIQAERVVELAADRSVEVVPLSRYVSGDSRPNGLILGFAAVDPRELRRGVEELAKILHRKNQE